MYGNGGHDWAWTGMATGMALFWVLIALALLAAAIWGHRASGPPAGSTDVRRAPDARAVLATRLARGEIDVAEYESRRAALERAGD